MMFASIIERFRQPRRGSTTTLAVDMRTCSSSERPAYLTAAFRRMRKSFIADSRERMELG
jgi:hypothetical protein